MEQLVKMDKRPNFYGYLSYVEKNNKISINWEIKDDASNIVARFPISNLSRISIARKNIFRDKNLYCSATSWKKCEDCGLYPDFCGKAIVYIRTIVYKGGLIKFKVGTSNNLIRPLTQSAPFAVVSRDLLRRDALMLEKKLSSMFKKLVQNPRGRTLWMNVIEGGYWDGSKEYRVLVSFLEEFYRKIDKTDKFLSDKIADPVIYKPGKNFASKLPKWVKLMDEFDVRKMFKKDPVLVTGDIIANRATLMVLEINGNVLFFEPKEKMVYKINNIEGQRGFAEMYIKEGWEFQRTVNET